MTSVLIMLGILCTPLLAHFYPLNFKNFLSEKLYLFSYPSLLMCVLVVHKNRFIEMVLLSTHNI